VVVLSSFLLCGFTGPTPVTFKSAAPDLATGKPLSIRGLLAKPDGAGPFPDDRHSSYLRRGTPQLRHVWSAFFVKQGYVSLTADSCGSREVVNCSNDFTWTTAADPLRPHKAIAEDAPLPFVAIIGQKDERILRNCRIHLPRGPNTKLHVLPGAYHAFDTSFFRTLRHGFKGTPMLYSETATKNAWKIVFGFFWQTSQKIGKEFQAALLSRSSSISRASRLRA
jgi:hypothetical protein